MTLEQIYERMKKENPYYNGSQAQKEEQAGMVVKNNTVNHTDESAQIHKDYMNNQPTFNKYITGAPIKDTFIQAKRSTKQLGKNFISGAGSGVRGIIDNTFQETENNLKKGENSNKNLWQHILKSTAYTLNPNVSFIDNIISSNKNATNILKDKNKSGYEKVANIVTDGVTNVVDTSTTGKKGLDASIELLGKLSQNNSEKISDKVQEVQNKVDEPFKKYDEKVQKDNNNFGNGENFLFNVSNSLGNMAPSIVASAVTKNPNVGLATMGYSVKGQSTEEAREKGQELQKAIDIGNTKGAIEVGTELLTGGINFFGKGALDDIAKRGIDSKVKNQVLNFIAKKGYDFAGEIGEETVSDILNTMLDKGTTDPNIKYSIKDWSDTALSTLLSTAVLNTIGGGYTKKAYNQNAQELINNKELPIQSYQYEKSENNKINALRQDANKYFNNTEQSHNFVNMLEKIITDKNVEIKFDANLKTPDGRVANGSYSNGVITINPNSNKAGEFIAIHELTHAIGTDSMKNIIETYRKSNTEFDTSVKKLLQNYNSSEITEEALSDVSAQLFGNQEFINNIAQNNPNIFQKIYSEIKYLWHQFRGYKNQNQFVEDLYYKWTQAYNSSNKLNETSNYYIETIEDFDEIKYNNAKELKLPKREYAILSGIVNSDSNIKPGINYVETTNATYEVYFKEIGEFKVVGKIVDGGYNDTITNGNIQGTGNTGNAKSRMQVHSSTIQQSRTGTRNDEISNFNQKRTGISDTSIGNGSSNSSNIKYSIQESENNSGSFNLQKNRFDVSGNENLANAQTLFYRTRDDGQYYVQATDGSGKITYDGVFYGEKQLARSLGEEIANKIVNTSESTNNEIYLQSDNIKSETDYMMAHRPTETGAYASNITKGTGEWDSLMPEDVYEHPEWYFDMNQEYSKESFKVLKQIKNNPNAEITIYRATTGNKINKGDWVTLSKKYAEYHNNSQFEGKGNIIELKVKAKDVQYAGDDINEFGYYPSENIKYNKIDANMSVQDNQGRTLTKEQQEYFKDSKVRDENGNLEVMYHGTDNGGFNTFDINKFGKNDNGWLGKGFYLTNDFDYAESYAKELYSDEYTQNGEVKETYINLKNPYILTDEKYSRNPTLLQEELGAKNSTEVTEILKTKGYDGVLLEYEDYKGNNFKEVMVFNSNQIKNIDNTNPTDNPDIRFSQNNTTWQSYLDENYKPTGTRTNLQDIKLPTKEWIENRQKLKKSQNNIPIAKEYINKNTLNPLQISNLTENDVTTTPKLPDIKYKTDKGKKSDFYDNLMNKTGMLNDDLRKIIKNQDDIKYYEGVTNVQSLREANERLQKDGSKEALRWFSKDLSDKNTTVSASEVAEGWILLKQYQDSGDYESAVSVAKRMRDMATKSGQALQAYSIQARLTPEGMFQYAQSELQDAFERFSKNKTQEWIDEHRQDFDLKPEETQAIIDKVKEAQELPNNSYEKKEKLAEINKIMTDKLPPERGAGIKSWMRISMLFNPKTQVRNILGNAVVAPVNAVGDVFSTIADKTISKKTGVRTTGLSNPVSNIKGLKKGIYESYNDFKKDINTRDMSGNRFEVKSTQMEGKSFKNKGLGKVLNKIDSILNFALDAGDRPFYEATFTNSINNQLVLNNTDVVTQDMIDIATNEALSRTWQDNNNYTKFVLSTRNALNKVNVKGYGLGDILIPFAKTPANLTKAIVDYSPIGLVNTLVEGNNVRKAIGRGDLTAQQQHKFVQDLGKATAGSMLYILGYALAKAGITSGESDDDKDVANFMKNTLGTTQYSVKIGNKSFTYDWAQPVAAPFSMMANLVNKSNKEANLLEKITSTLNVPLNNILEQSFMQSINTVLTNNSGPADGLFEAVSELPSRAIPTFMKQIVDMTDTTQRTTYEKGKPIETAVNKVKAKVPGLSKQLAPVSDTLGNDVKKYGGETNPFLYAFHTFINPANVNSNQKNKAGSEVYKVYQKTGDKTIFPRQAEYTQIIDGTKITLTSNERYQYQKTSGKYYSNVVNELLKSNTYKKLSAAEKSKILTEIASDSNELAKEKLAKEKKLKYERPDTDVKIDELVTNGLEYGNAYIYKTQVNSIKGDKKDDKAISGSSNAKKAKYIMNMDTKDNQKDMMLSLLTDTDTKPTVSDLKKLNGNYLTYMQQSGKKDDKGVSARDKYMIYIDAGIPVTTLNKYYDEIGDIEGIKNSNGKTISGSKKKALFNYINSLSLNATQKKILFTKCNSSYGKNYKSEIHAYINSLNISKQRKEQIWNELYD